MQTTQIYYAPASQIRWKQVWSLIALDVAIVISWIAYHKYQPNLLQQFGFKQFAFQLAIVQGIILFLTPPIAGLIADRIRQRSKERLPVINVGINVVSMVFMAVAFTIFVNPTGWITAIFPLMIVLWLVSMNIFHSPAISMVEVFVPVDRLPLVVALLAVVTGLAEATEPIISDVIDFFGAPITFAAGGALVFLTGWLLQKSTQAMEGEPPPSTDPSVPAVVSKLWLVFLLGLGLGAATAFFFNVAPALADAKLPFLAANKIKGNFFVSLLIAGSALLTFPMSWLATKQGTVRMATLGFVGVFTLMGLMYFLSGGILVEASFFLYPFAFSTIAVTALPIAFSNISQAQKVLGVGLFFSGVELVNSIIEVLQAAG
ncbi:MAG TPA: hypothetical protein DCM08_01300 [Microscillaceae bacterium]|nr:hypothetical protein [Microscillaceae bacterium]